MSGVSLGSGVTATDASSSRLIGGYVDGTLTANQRLFRKVMNAGENFSVGNALVGFAANAKVAATAQTVLLVRVNGVQIGSLTFPAGGLTATPSGSATLLYVTDDIEIAGPATPDSTLSGVDFAISLAQIPALPASVNLANWNYPLRFTQNPNDFNLVFGTMSALATDPFGVPNNAVTFKANAGSGLPRFQVTFAVNGGVGIAPGGYICSIYVKPGTTANWAGWTKFQVASTVFYVQLATGTFGSTFGPGLGLAATPIGNGVYRISAYIPSITYAFDGWTMSMVSGNNLDATAFTLLGTETLTASNQQAEVLQVAGRYKPGAFVAPTYVPAS